MLWFEFFSPMYTISDRVNDSKLKKYIYKSV